MWLLDPQPLDRHQARRLVATSTPGAPDPQDSFDLAFWLAKTAVKLLMGDAYADIVKTAAVIRESGLDWTIVRLPLLSNGPKVPSRPGTRATERSGYLGWREKT
ncbi:MAG: NAD(P)H-binding protein [Bacillota bacterium]